MTVRVAKVSRKMLRSVAQTGKLRGFFIMLGMLAICLQSFAPNMAQAADLEWMVICSEDGTKLVQVDFSDGTEHEPCPDCENCAFCATAPGVTNSHLPVPNAKHALISSDIGFGAVPVLWNSDYLWPVTRGPPSGHNDKKDRAFRAFPVSNSNKGEAL